MQHYCPKCGEFINEEQFALVFPTNRGIKLKNPNTGASIKSYPRLHKCKKHKEVKQSLDDKLANGFELMSDE